MHTSYLWHLHQPIYWNGKRASGDRYEYALDTILAKQGGRTYPFDQVADIFGVDDREAVYQFRVRDSIQTILGQPDAGAQLTYSGSLIENVDSLAGNRNPYYTGWEGSYNQARNWTTSSGKPRLDIVNFTFHHSLAPLMTSKTVEMELRLMRQKMMDKWGMSQGQLSKGFFPTEMAFSRHLIPILKAQGIEWSIVSGNHISRACSNFPLVLGTGGENCQPPNGSDILNPAQGFYYRQTISRGCSPCNAAPLAYTPQQAQCVNPNNGAVEKLVVVPAAQEFSWVDGYQSFGANQLSPIASYNNTSRPMLTLLAHDGDNAYGGGYSYYMQDVQNFVGSAVSAGYKPSTIQQYLTDFPVPNSAVVHVEDGAWVNADSDFGSPTFINWNYPLLSAAGQIDPINGWHEKPREYAVFLAAENRVRTAEQVSGLQVRLNKILYPDGTTNHLERAWHYYLGSLDSGNIYYGAPGDMEVKGSAGCNEAVANANQLLGGGFTDLTEPTLWLPQRWPYNPGGVNFGVETGYQQKVLGPDFSVWTFAYDVSGISNITLKWRVDGDGQNPLASTHNETYAGGGEVGTWQSLPMNVRAFPKGNIYNKPEINYYIQPDYIADHASATITGQAGKLIDYYIEAVDPHGNIARSVIQHVYVGTQTGSGGGGGGEPSNRVTLNPVQPIAGQQVMVQYNPAAGVLQNASPVFQHWGTNNWANVVSPDVAMTSNPVSQRWETTVTLSQTATQLDLVFNNGSGTWDNNGGADWHFPVTGGAAPPYILDGLAESNDLLRATGTSNLQLWALVQGTTLYVGMNGAASARDHYIFITSATASLRSAPWAKAGSVAVWDAFLADEADNSFSGWFNANQAQTLGAFTQKADGGSAGVIEGTVDLAQLYGSFGNIPRNIYLAAAAFQTPDGGALQLQAPASIDGNGNLNAGEFFLLDSGVPVALSSWELE